jgi:hypothetical protein
MFLHPFLVKMFTIAPGEEYHDLCYAKGKTEAQRFP